MERAEALAMLHRLAAGIHEPTEEEAVARFLERVANAEPELSAALLERGALAVIREMWVKPSHLLEAVGMGRTRRGL